MNSVAPVSVRSCNPQGVADRQRERDEARSDQLAQPRRDEVEQRLELQLTDERAADLVERLELLRPGRGRFVEAGVFDGHRGLGGEQRHQLLVLHGEVAAPLLLGEVEIAVGDVAKNDRHAEKGAHRRVPGRKAHGAWIVGESVEAQRPRVADQHAQDSTSVRRVADLRLELGAHAVGDEALEARAGGIDHSESRVARGGHSGGRFDDAPEHSVERQLRVDCDTRFDQRSQTLALTAHRHGPHGLRRRGLVREFHADCLRESRIRCAVPHRWRAGTPGLD